MATATIIGATTVRDYEFLVDTGSTHVGLPQSEIDELGLEPVPGEILEVMTATGLVDMQAYGITGMIDGRGFVTMVTPCSVPVIGYELLENLRYRVNPVSHSLERIPRDEPGPPYRLISEVVSKQ